MPMQATTTAPLFSAALKPDRSSRLVGGWVGLVVAAVLASPFAVVVSEALVPIAVAFLVGAGTLLTLSVRQSREGRTTQQVTLWSDQLEVVETPPKGERTLRRFDPRTVRLVLRRDDNEKAVAMELRTGADAFELGAFLNPEDRSSFAKAFGTALRRARQQR